MDCESFVVHTVDNTVDCVCVYVCVWFEPVSVGATTGGCSYLFLPLQPAVHHGVIGAERRAGRLPLELPLIGPRAGVPWQAAVRVRGFALRGRRRSTGAVRLTDFKSKSDFVKKKKKKMKNRKINFPLACIRVGAYKHAKYGRRRRFLLKKTAARQTYFNTSLTP